MTAEIEQHRSYMCKGHKAKEYAHQKKRKKERKKKEIEKKKKKLKEKMNHVMLRVKKEKEREGTRHEGRAAMKMQWVAKH